MFIRLGCLGPMMIGLLNNHPNLPHLAFLHQQAHITKFPIIIPPSPLQNNNNNNNQGTWEHNRMMGTFTNKVPVLNEYKISNAQWENLFSHMLYISQPPLHAQNSQTNTNASFHASLIVRICCPSKSYSYLPPHPVFLPHTAGMVPTAPGPPTSWKGAVRSITNGEGRGYVDRDKREMSLIRGAGYNYSLCQQVLVEGVPWGQRLLATLSGAQTGWRQMKPDKWAKKWENQEPLKDHGARITFFG